MHDLSVGAWHAHKFLRAKRFFVKLNRFGRVFCNYRGRYCVEALRNRSFRNCHVYLLIFKWLENDVLE
jgi:hypothetical protein